MIDHEIELLKIAASLAIATNPKHLGAAEIGGTTLTIARILRTFLTRKELAEANGGEELIHEKPTTKTTYSYSVDGTIRYTDTDTISVKEIRKRCDISNDYAIYMMGVNWAISSVDDDSIIDLSEDFPRVSLLTRRRG